MRAYKTKCVTPQSEMALHKEFDKKKFVSTTMVAHRFVSARRRKRYRPTDRPTNQPTDGQTHPHNIDLWLTTKNKI